MHCTAQSWVIQYNINGLAYVACREYLAVAYCVELGEEERKHTCSFISTVKESEEDAISLYDSRPDYCLRQCSSSGLLKLQHLENVIRSIT